MPEIQAKLQFLQSPASYGCSCQQVELMETHMSWVFMLAQQVFKVKKPVRFPFLDFTTLQARAFYCREEVRLKARLAPGSISAWPTCTQAPALGRCSTVRRAFR